MKKYIAMVAMGLVFAVGANAQTRSRYIDGPEDQGHLQFYDETSGVDQLTFSDSGVAATNLQVNSRFPILGANATNFFVLSRGTATNGQTVTFSSVFASAPQVFVDYAAYVATNSPAGPSSVTTSNFVANGTAALTLNWLAIGPK